MYQMRCVLLNVVHIVNLSILTMLTIATGVKGWRRWWWRRRRRRKLVLGPGVGGMSFKIRCDKSGLRNQ